MAGYSSTYDSGFDDSGLSAVESRLEGILAQSAAMEKMSAKNKELQKEVNQLTNEVRYLKRELEESENAPLLNALKQQAAAAAEEFRAFLTTVKLAGQRGTEVDEFNTLYSAIRKGSITVTEAIAKVKLEYADVIEMVNSSGDLGSLFDVSELKFFESVIERLESSLNEVLTIVRVIRDEGVSIGGSSSGEKEMSGMLTKIADAARESGGELKELYTVVNELIQSLSALGASGDESLYSIQNILDSILKMGSSDVNFNGIESLRVDNESIRVLAECLPQIAAVDMSSLQTLAGLDFSNLSSLKIDTQSAQGLASLSQAQDVITNINDAANKTVVSSGNQTTNAIESASQIQGIGNAAKESTAEVEALKTEIQQLWSDSGKISGMLTNIKELVSGHNDVELAGILPDVDAIEKKLKVVWGDFRVSGNLNALRTGVQELTDSVTALFNKAQDAKDTIANADYSVYTDNFKEQVEADEQELNNLKTLLSGRDDIANTSGLVKELEYATQVIGAFKNEALSAGGNIGLADDLDYTYGQIHLFVEALTDLCCAYSSAMNKIQESSLSKFQFLQDFDKLINGKITQKSVTAFNNQYDNILGIGSKDDLRDKVALLKEFKSAYASIETLRANGVDGAITFDEFGTSGTDKKRINEQIELIRMLGHEVGVLTKNNGKFQLSIEIDKGSSLTSQLMNTIFNQNSESSVSELNKRLNNIFSISSADDIKIYVERFKELKEIMSQVLSLSKDSNSNAITSGIGINAAQEEKMQRYIKYAQMLGYETGEIQKINSKNGSYYEAPVSFTSKSITDPEKMTEALMQYAFVSKEVVNDSIYEAKAIKDLSAATQDATESSLSIGNAKVQEEMARKKAAAATQEESKVTSQSNMTAEEAIQLSRELANEYNISSESAQSAGQASRDAASAMTEEGNAAVIASDSTNQLNKAMHDAVETGAEMTSLQIDKVIGADGVEKSRTEIVKYMDAVTGMVTTLRVSGDINGDNSDQLAIVSQSKTFKTELQELMSIASNDGKIASLQKKILNLYHSLEKVDAAETPLGDGLKELFEMAGSLDKSDTTGDFAVKLKEIATQYEWINLQANEYKNFLSSLNAEEKAELQTQNEQYKVRKEYADVMQRLSKRQSTLSELGDSSVINESDTKKIEELSIQMYQCEILATGLKKAYDDGSISFAKYTTGMQSIKASMAEEKTEVAELTANVKTLTEAEEAEARQETKLSQMRNSLSNAIRGLETERSKLERSGGKGTEMYANLVEYKHQLSSALEILEKTKDFDKVSEIFGQVGYDSNMNAMDISRWLDDLFKANDAAKAENQLAKLQSQITATQNKLAQYGNPGEGLSGQLEEVSTKSQKLFDDFKTGRISMQQFQTGLLSLGASYLKLSSDADTAMASVKNDSAINQAEKKITSLRSSISELQRELSSHGLEGGGMYVELQSMSESLFDAFSKLDTPEGLQSVKTQTEEVTIRIKEMRAELADIAAGDKAAINKNSALTQIDTKINQIESTITRLKKKGGLDEIIDQKSGQTYGNILDELKSKYESFRNTVDSDKGFVKTDFSKQWNELGDQWVVAKGKVAEYNAEAAKAVDLNTAKNKQQKLTADINKQISELQSFDGSEQVKAVVEAKVKELQSYLTQLNNLVNTLESTGNVQGFNLGYDELNRALKDTTASNQAFIASQNEVAKSIKAGQSSLGSYNSAMRDYDKVLKKWTAATQTSKKEIVDAVAAIKTAGEEMEAAKQKFDVDKKTGSAFSETVTKNKQIITENMRLIDNMGYATKSVSDRVKGLAEKFSMWFGTSQIIMKVVQSMKELVTQAIEVDTAMTQLKIVTNETDETYAQFAENISKAAQELGTSVTELIDATTTYSRLGYSLEESTDLAKYTQMLTEVGNIDSEAAQDAMTSIIKAFNIDSSQIESTMDKLVEVGKNIAHQCGNTLLARSYIG